MHEMSLMESVREIVEQTARANGARRVARVQLQIGALAAVEPEALRFCFEVVMNDGVAAGAALDIQTVPGAAWCWDCSRSVTLEHGGCPCPGCGGQRLQITAGTEMRVHEIDLQMEQESSQCV